jgi:hypothetical protein
MKPTRRDLLGAAVLALILVVLVVAIVASAYQPTPA